MRQLLSGIGFIVLAVLGAYAAFAQKDIYSADYIVPGCRDFIRVGTGNAHLRGYCVDLVIGLARDAYAPRICVPREGSSIHRRPARSTARRLRSVSDRGITQNLAMWALASGHF
jgi:hypothetical protein